MNKEVPNSKVIYGWGDCSNGKLCKKTESEFDYQSEPIKIVIKDTNVNFVTCGAHNTSFSSTNGSVYVCGVGLSNYNSSILGHPTMEKSWTPLPIPRGPTSFLSVKQVSLGNYHAALLTTCGQVYTWGWGKMGQLGHGNDTNLSEPKRVQISCAKQISCGTKFTVVLTKFGELLSFGENDQGQLGIGNLQGQFSPVKVKKIENVIHVGCGASHVVAVCSDNSNNENSNVVWIWGQINSNGKVQSLPQEEESLANLNIYKVSCGQFHTLALSRFGKVYEWKLGEPAKMVRGQLQGHFVKDIEAGSFHSLALTHSGKLFSWGRNKTGQLGRTDVKDTDGPGQIIIKTKSKKSKKRMFISHISAGEFHNTCIVEKDPLRLLVWKLIKDEKVYLVNLDVLVNIYMKEITPTTPLMLSPDEKTKYTDRRSSFGGLIRTHSKSVKKSRITTSGFRELVSSNINDVISTIFSNIKAVYDLHSQFIVKLESVIEDRIETETIIESISSLFLNEIQKFGVYLYYSDHYTQASYSLHLLCKSYPSMTDILKTLQDKANSLHQRVDKPMFRDFSLKELLIVPLKRIAQYNKVFKSMKDLIGEEHTTFNECYSYMSGLLERICSNFNFVDPLEILTSTLDDIGNPQIGGGTLESLVERLTHHKFIDMDFTNAFLLTYREFMKPSQLIDLLIQRYSYMPEDLPEKDRANYHLSVRKPVQHRVINTIIHWLQSPHSHEDIEKDSKEKKSVISKIKKFVEILDNEEEYKIHAHRISMLCNQGSSKSSIISIPKAEEKLESVSSPRKSGKLNSILQFEDPKALAITIAVRDYTVLKQISPREFLDKSWSKDNFKEIAPNLYQMTQNFNQLGLWVTHEIVKHESSKDRANVITLMIQTAQHLLELRDYNSMFAIMGGLNNSSISRLKKSFAKLGQKATQTFTELNELASGKENYKSIRQLWNNAEPPSIPFLAMTLKDLTFVEDGNPSTLDNGGINFYKWRKLSFVINECLQYRDIPYSYSKDKDVEEYLNQEILKSVEIGDEGIYALSKKLE